MLRGRLMAAACLVWLGQQVSAATIIESTFGDGDFQDFRTFDGTEDVISGLTDGITTITGNHSGTCTGRPSDRITDCGTLPVNSTNGGPADIFILDLKAGTTILEDFTLEIFNVIGPPGLLVFATALSDDPSSNVFLRTDVTEGAPVPFGAFSTGPSTLAGDQAFFWGTYAESASGLGDFSYDWRMTINLDVPDVAPAVPLPSSAALILSGLGALGIVRRRRRAA